MELNKEIIEKIKSELQIFSEDDFEQMYDDALDDSGEVTIAGNTYQQSYALKLVDPVAYRVGLADFTADVMSEYTEIEKDVFVNIYELEQFLEDNSNE